MIQVGYGQVNSEGDIVDVIDSTVDDGNREVADITLVGLRDAKRGSTSIKYFFLQMELVPGEGNFRKVCYLDPL